MKWEVLLVDDYHLNYNSSIYTYFRSFLPQFCGNLVYNMQNIDQDKASNNGIRKFTVIYAV